MFQINAGNQVTEAEIDVFNVGWNCHRCVHQIAAGFESDLGCAAVERSLNRRAVVVGFITDRAMGSNAGCLTRWFPDGSFLDRQAGHAFSLFCISESAGMNPLVDMLGIGKPLGFNIGDIKKTCLAIDGNRSGPCQHRV